MIDRTCSTCSKIFKVKNYRTNPIIYCSIKCKRNGNFYKGKPIVDGDRYLCYTCLNYLPKENFYERKDGSACLVREGLSQRCKTCNADITKKWKDKTLMSIEGTLRFALKRAKSSSKKRKLEFNIDYTYLLELLKKQDNRCAITGELLKNSENKYEYDMVSIDRINSDLGYIKGNVHLICWVINQMKNDMPIDKFILWCNKVKS